MKKIPPKIEHILEMVNKPGRYIGNEINSVIKKWDDEKVKFAIIFPDSYEIGMSNVGIRILYDILNRYDDFIAERCFTPLPDMATLLREHKILLYSLENFMPLNKFDFIGFSLESELTYTNILETLDLSGVQIWSKDRAVNAPLVVAGGPCVFNPEPIADFFDLIVIGDGEETIVKIGKKIQEIKNKKYNSRIDKLREFASIEGVYVPLLYKAKFDQNGKFTGMDRIDDNVPALPISRAIVKNLNYDNYFHKYIIPFVTTVHERVPIEIMRGCVRGCRFCQAGMIYRPARERSAKDVLALLNDHVEDSIFDEVSFLSLSTSDYTNLDNLIENVAPILENNNISLSLPSTRIDKFTNKLADSLNHIHVQSLTFAAEAGTQRLRNIINKNLTEDEICDGVTTAFKNGWKLCKLYFMVGLPMEMEEDIVGIVDLIRKCSKIARKMGNRNKINVSIATFIPKAHTPFQWSEQVAPEKILDKIRFIKENTRKFKAVKVNWHDPYMSYVEGFLSRGDRRMSKLIYEAWENGAKFDQWKEYWNVDIWQNALEKLNIEKNDYFSEKELEDILPWDHIDSKITKSFLKKEWENAKNGILTDECKTKTCKLCGICNSEIKNVLNKDALPTSMKRRATRKKVDYQNTFSYRLKYEKKGMLRFISHLNIKAIIENLIRKGHIPICRSEGFNIHMRLKYSQPLPLFYESNGEYVDIRLCDDWVPQVLLKKMNYYEHFLKFTSIARIRKNIQPLNKLEYSLYSVIARTQDGMDFIQNVMSNLSDEYKNYIEKAKILENGIRLLIKIEKSGKTIRPSAIFGEEHISEFRYVREDLLIRNENGEFLDLLGIRKNIKELFD